MPRPSNAGGTTADAQAFRICRDVCRRTGGDFYLATFFLPRQKRDAVHAVYAFCNLIANAVRSQHADAPVTTPGTVGVACCSTNSLDGRITLLRQRIDHLYASPDAVPFSLERGTEQGIACAFARTLRLHTIPKEYLLDLIEGCRVEATVSRFATWKSIDRYLGLRWGSIALAVAAVLGLTSSDAREHVVEFGKAVGMTRLLGDLPSRLAAGTVPLPLEDLAASGFSERDLIAGIVNDKYHRLMRLEVDRAGQLFTSARRSIPWLAGDGSRLMAATIATLYERSLDHLLDGRGPTPARLSTWQRLRLLPAIWTTARAAAAGARA